MGPAGDRAGSCFCRFSCFYVLSCICNALSCLSGLWCSILLNAHPWKLSTWGENSSQWIQSNELLFLVAFHVYTMGVILRPPGDHGPVWWLKAAETQCDRGPFQKQGHLSSSSLWSQPASGVKLCTSKCSTSKGKLGSFSFFNLLFYFSSIFFSFCKTQFLLLRQHFCQALTFLSTKGWRESNPSFYTS